MTDVHLCVNSEEAAKPPTTWQGGHSHGDYPPMPPILALPLSHSGSLGLARLAEDRDSPCWDRQKRSDEILGLHLTHLPSPHPHNRELVGEQGDVATQCLGNSVGAQKLRGFNSVPHPLSLTPLLLSEVRVPNLLGPSIWGEVSRERVTGSRAGRHLQGPQTLSFVLRTRV